MKKKILALFCAAAMLLVSGCSGNESSDSIQTSATESTTVADITDTVTEEEILESLNNGIVVDEVSGNVYKTERNANPISGIVQTLLLSSTRAGCMSMAQITLSRQSRTLLMITSI